MPSAARLNFERHLLKDVDALIKAHREGLRRGRPPSVLTRSGTFLLCAAWELYCEEVLLESFSHILARCGGPTNLHLNVQKTLALAIKNEKSELAPLQLAGDGWKAYLNTHAETRVKQLNTPSVANITDLFSRIVGVDVTPSLQPHEIRLRSFISKRGDIAHQGAQAGHVSINDLEADKLFICRLVVELDNFLIAPVQQISGHRPWNARQ